jgi:cell division protein FtsW
MAQTGTFSDRPIDFGRNLRSGAKGETEIESAWSLWIRSTDHWTINACLVLFAIGVVLAFATSPDLAARNNLEPFHYAWRHLLFGAPAFLAVFLFSLLTPKWVRRMGAIIALVAIIALALLPFYGLDHGKSAQRWLSIAGLSVQPSEILKPGLIVLCAWMLSALPDKDPQVARGGVVAALFFLALAVGLLIVQPDYGQAMLLVSVWTAMFFLAGGSIWALFLVGFCVLGIAAAAYQFEPHIAARIDAFLDPVASAQGQLQSAEQAILNGGWFGRGLGEGIAKATLPDAHSDFILAVAIEEYGFLLGAGLIFLFAIIPLRAMARLRGERDLFIFIAGIGLALLFGAQAFIHIAVSTQILPATGMTLPFVSYGGSSLLATGVTLGMMLALTRQSERAADAQWDAMG